MFGLIHKLKLDSLITSLVFDCDALIGATEDRCVLTIDLDTFLLTRTIKATHITDASFKNSTFIHIEIASNGSSAAVACSDSSILILDLRSGLWTDRVFGHQGLISHLYFTPDADFLVSVGPEESISVWNLEISAQLTRSQSDSWIGGAGAIDFEVKDEFLPTWIRKPSKNCTPSTPLVVPKGKWAQVGIMQFNLKQ